MAAVDKQAGVDHICRSKEDSQSQERSIWFFDKTGDLVAA